MGKKTAATAATSQKDEDAGDEDNSSVGQNARPARKGSSSCPVFLVGFLLGVAAFLSAAIGAVTLGREHLLVFLSEERSEKSGQTKAAQELQKTIDKQKAELEAKQKDALRAVELDKQIEVLKKDSAAAADLQKRLDTQKAELETHKKSSAKVAELEKKLADQKKEAGSTAKVQQEFDAHRKTSEDALKAQKTELEGHKKEALRAAELEKQLEVHKQAEQGKQCSNSPPVNEGDASSCDKPLAELRSQLQDSERASCDGRLAELSTQVQDRCESRVSELAAQLEETKGAEAGCEGRVSELSAALEASLSEKQQAKGTAPQREAWPECVERGVVFRGHGTFADFEDLTALFGDVATGCWNGHCQQTDKFETPRIEDCAQACANLAGCAFWTHGEQDGIAKCFLRTGDGGRELADGFVSGSEGCAPTASTVRPSQAALAVLDSEQLRRCEDGKGAGCEDIHNAMRTWLYGIENLKLAMEGAGDHLLGEHLEQIWADAVAFVNTEADAEGLESVYPIAVKNNRVVFEAVRGFLSEQSEPVNHLDASMPRPVRGLLCDGPGSCQV